MPLCSCALVGLGLNAFLCTGCIKPFVYLVLLQAQAAAAASATLSSTERLVDFGLLMVGGAWCYRVFGLGSNLPGEEEGDGGDESQMDK